jgi:hypothetical protein
VPCLGYQLSNDGVCLEVTRVQLGLAERNSVHVIRLMLMVSECMLDGAHWVLLNFPNNVNTMLYAVRVDQNFRSRTNLKEVSR